MVTSKINKKSVDKIFSIFATMSIIIFYLMFIISIIELISRKNLGIWPPMIILIIGGPVLCVSLIFETQNILLKKVAPYFMSFCLSIELFRWLNVEFNPYFIGMAIIATISIFILSYMIIKFFPKWIMIKMGPFKTETEKRIIIRIIITMIYYVAFNNIINVNIVNLKSPHFSEGLI